MLNAVIRNIMLGSRLLIKFLTCLFCFCFAHCSLKKIWKSILHWKHLEFAMHFHKSTAEKCLTFGSTSRRSHLLIKICRWALHKTYWQMFGCKFELVNEPHYGFCHESVLMRRLSWGATLQPLLCGTKQKDLYFPGFFVKTNDETV